MINRFHMTLLLIFSLLFQISAYAEIPVDSFRVLALHEKDIIVPAVYQYHSKILELEQDRLNLKKDKEWVAIRMEHIQDQNRLIPSELKEASETFSYKMQLIGKEITRLTGLNQRHIETLRKLDKEVKKKYNNNLPSWWQLDDWIIKLLYPATHPLSVKTDAISVKSERVVPVNKKSDNLAGDIQQKIKEIELGNWVELFPNEKRMRLEVQLPILFGSGKSNVATDYKKFFQKLSWLLKPYPVEIEVAGFTDSNPVSGGKYASNIELGVSRATNVVKELVSTGLKQSSFKIISQSEKPDNSDRENKFSAAMKRRVEVNVFFDDNEA